MLSFKHLDTGILRETNKTEKKKKSSEINPHIYNQLTFNKGAKNTQWEKYNVFNKWYWGTGVLGRLNIHMQRIKVDAFLTVHTKWIKD